MMKKSLIFLLVLVLVLSAVLAGCQPKEEAVDTPQDEVTKHQQHLQMTK